MIRYQFFPRSHGITEDVKAVINCFKTVDTDISSDNLKLNSNAVLEKLRPHLEAIDYFLETGYDNEIDKSFNADALSKDGKIVIEVEAGRAVDNNQFLKDIFQACMMFEVEYLVIAVRNDYRGSDDFKKIYTFLETLYISSRLHLPLKGILLVGY